MVMKKIILVLSVLSVVAFSLYVSVDVSGNIKADTNYIEYPTVVSEKPIKLVFNLENIGSVTCDTYYKVDFKRENETIYTAWSRKSVLKPGDIELFNVYWNPNEIGTITVSPKLYMCGDMYNLHDFEVNITGIINKTTDEVELKYKNTENSIKLALTANESKKVYVIPVEYPQGWRFEPIELNLKKGENVAEMKFYTPFFVESDLKLNIVSEDGEINDVEVIELKKPKWYETLTPYEVGFYLVLLVAVIELFFILKRVNWRRIKRKWKI